MRESREVGENRRELAQELARVGESRLAGWNVEIKEHSLMINHPTKITRHLVALAAALALSMPLSVSAVQATIEASVTRTLAVRDESFGGCMVLLTANPTDEGLDCDSSAWVSFDCTGESRANAARLFDSALMAFVMERPISITVDDGQKRGRYCVATRVDVLGE